MGIPISKRGLEVTSIPISEWVTPFQNGDSVLPHFETGITVSKRGFEVISIPVSEWGSPFQNGD
jgi:hypothetical protein